MTLDGEDREFFGLVARAAFSNPFGEEREETDLSIAGVDSDDPAEVLAAVVATVARRIEALETADLRDHGPRDRETLQIAFLFEVFHRHAEAFDALIVEQLAAGASSRPVPFARDALADLVGRGFNEEEAERFLAFFYQLRRAYHFIGQTLLGTSRSMRHLRQSLWNNVFTDDIRLYERYLWNRMEDFSTLVLGETGTGKGTAAAAIGRSGWIPFDRRRGVFAESFTETFLSINLSQFPEGLIESELFGHKKGAFTGAVEDHLGVFDRGSPYGAIFLDEIGEVSIPVQIKLLRILQERVYSPVGSHETRRFRGRVLAATNRSIDEARRRGEFRDDFFYRLSSDILVVPPLRTRIAEDPGELDLLLETVVERLVGEPDDELVASSRRSIDRHLGPDYPWPGNVRELEQCVRRVILTRRYTGDRAAAAGGLEERLVEGLRQGTIDARDLLAGYCRLLHERHGTYEEVARRVGLDRRTVKKHIETDG